MARTREKAERLVAEDGEMADALTTILQTAESGDGEVEWADVREDITSGQWGRIIETGILVDGNRGFVIDEPEALGEALGIDGEDPSSADGETESDGEVSWSQWDKMAAIATVGLFLGYLWGPMRGAIGGGMNLLLGPVNEALPFYAVILVLALFTGLYSTILQANLMDTEIMGEVQEQMKDIQERRKAAQERGDEEAVERIQQEQMEAMGDQMKVFKAQFRPMIWIMLFTIPVFLWMYWKLRDGDPYAVGSVVFPLVGELETWRSGLVGPIEAWIVWYFLCSMGFTQIIRKSLNVRATPTG